MTTPRSILYFLPLLLAAGVMHAQSAADVARGNMHFDAKEMDANGDGMISKDEMQKYGESMWDKMARNDSRTIPVTEAGQDFARGNLKFDAKAMDTDKDGQITKDEFLKYGGSKFDAMKKDSHGMISVADAARDFGRGGMHLDQPKPAESAADSAPR